ncbi:PREDICTED: centrosomal protein of 57 kDa-like [Amphimedon queenslandica]|uniref:Cep57 centrosome localisation domain-containing protein n=1 Tax=Amphimedon queenslandica TaxID=400682 RepID=A0A1X7VHY7_AMPQE|nr:PREDICTED: centrosomal protein of 57 kDa-like [Amphimedon queenslandica]|eukprot:XP_011410098.1 PREDICTED: centrosomal protein of 57 kDa-like [Amphimedon queenslandica]
MEEGSDGSSSVLSSPSSTSATSAVSFKKQPLHLYGEYKPLSGVYNKHHQPLPLALTGIKDSNSEGFISALKSLQSKIHQLEVDRTLAAGKFKKLSDETRHQVLSSGARENQREKERSNEDGRASRETTSPERQPTRDFSHRLDSLDTRYSLQLQEIELMKDRLKRTTGEQDGREKENQETIDLSTPPPPPPLLSDVSPLKETEERLQILEDKQAKLQAEQVFASSKLDNLEGRLLQKQWQKRQAQKTAPSRLQYLDDDDDRDRRDGGQRRKKKAPVTTTCSHRRKPPATADSVAVSKPIPGVHYHLRMKDVPFVVGTSTGPSHSVTANYQKVVSLMKSHNPLLCGAVAANSIPNPPPKRKTSPRGSKKKKKSCSFGSKPSCEELEGLLVALEAEFGRLTFEHSELATSLQQQQRQKKETSPSKSPQSPSRQDPVIGEIESELSRIVEQLEGKMEQIQIVKKLLASERKHRQVDTSNPKSHKKGRSYTDSHYHHDDDKSRSTSHHCTCSCYCTATRGDAASTRDCIAASSPRAFCNDNLKMLRKMKRLQTTLQRDDLSWT